MPKYRVSVNWEIEVEADDEGDAYFEADRRFDFYQAADAENLDSPREVWNSEKGCWEEESE